MHALTARLMTYGHVFYFGAVAVEGHGFYALFAGVLFLGAFVEAIFTAVGGGE